MLIDFLSINYLIARVSPKIVPRDVEKLLGCDGKNPQLDPTAHALTIQDEISFFAFINKRLWECARAAFTRSTVCRRWEKWKWEGKEEKKSSRRKASEILVFHQSMTSSNLFLLHDPRPRCMCWWRRGVTVSAFVDKLRVSLCESRSWKWCSICAGKKIATG